MNHLQKLVFISATIGQDDSMTNSLENNLKSFGFNYSKVIGCYEGIKEVSFMVTIHSTHNLNFMKHLGEVYKQDSILYRDHEGNSNLIFMDGRESINLGKMVQVSESEALSSIAYTYVPNLNSYWIAK